MDEEKLTKKILNCEPKEKWDVGCREFRWKDHQIFMEKKEQDNNDLIHEDYYHHYYYYYYYY